MNPFKQRPMTDPEH